MATAPSPNDLTRQQLDELDALLQRMLSVPMPTETPAPGGSLSATPQAANAPPLPPSWRVDPPAAPRPTSAPPTAKPQVAPSDPPSSVSLKVDTPPPLPPSAPAAPKPSAKAPATPVATPQAAAPKVAPKAPVIAPPAAKPVSVTAPSSATPQAAPTPPVAKPQAAKAITPAPAAPPVPFFLLPFVALNALFDTVCGLFGPPGRVLRSGFFKTLYGLTGVALILYTVMHVAQVEGWVTLPIQLPWPPRR